MLPRRWKTPLWRLNLPQWHVSKATITHYLKVLWSLRRGNTIWMTQIQRFWCYTKHKMERITLDPARFQPGKDIVQVKRNSRIWTVVRHTTDQKLGGPLWNFVRVLVLGAEMNYGWYLLCQIYLVDYNNLIKFSEDPPQKPPKSLLKASQNTLGDPPRQVSPNFRLTLRKHYK